MFEGGHQHDAHELLRTLINGLKEEVLNQRLAIAREELFSGKTFPVGHNSY